MLKIRKTLPLLLSLVASVRPWKIPCKFTFFKLEGILEIKYTNSNSINKEANLERGNHLLELQNYNTVKVGCNSQNRAFFLSKKMWIHWQKFVFICPQCDFTVKTKTLLKCDVLSSRILFQQLHSQYNLPQHWKCKENYNLIFFSLPSPIVHIFNLSEI